MLSPSNLAKTYHHPKHDIHGDAGSMRADTKSRTTKFTSRHMAVYQAAAAFAKPPSRAWRLVWSAVLSIVTIASATIAFADALAVPEYVGSARCADCHKDAYETWNKSHHALAWTAPTAGHVLGDFNQSSFTHKGVTTRFFREGEEFIIETDGPDRELTKYPVAGVAGVAPLQQYLLETEQGKLQSFDVVWDVEERRWYHLYPEQELRGGDAYHWTGPYKNWNGRCAECHATGFEKNYSPVNRTYASSQAEIGVGCESCHGPGDAHIAWADPALSYDADDWRGLSSVGLTMDFGKNTEADIQQCATCHARREPFLDGNPLPGSPFHDSYRLSTLRPGMYHADGQILEEVYVYGSFLQSKMYAEGVGCINCHEAHSADLKADGNGVCTQCHSSAGNPEFPSLRLAEYDSPAHHFHPAGSSGAQCKSCHMIERTYMGIDGRRDHSFRVPRPDLSVSLRTPNACSDCHSDRSPAWAADAVAQWYPDGRHTQFHFAQVLSPARLNPDNARDDLVDLAIYDGLPGIVRASAIDLLSEIGDPEIAERTSALLTDPDPLVRAAAVRLQRGAQGSVAIQNLLPLLDDPSQSVRIAAAREFLNIRALRLPSSVSQKLDRARNEWQQSLVAKADFPEAHIVIAGIALATRQFEAAVAAFEEVVTLDPQHIDAWKMIARIHAALGNRETAIRVLDDAIKANPQDISLSLLRTDMLP